jgi:pyruvate dehydrogenase E1 component alpha subunit
MVEYKLIQNDALDEEQLQEIRGEAKERVQEAVKFAEESEEPPEEELYTDVYSGKDEYLGEE